MAEEYFKSISEQRMMADDQSLPMVVSIMVPSQHHVSGGDVNASLQAKPCIQFPIQQHLQNRIPVIFFFQLNGDEQFFA
jgi:hypothetical protein